MFPLPGAATGLNGMASSWPPLRERRAALQGDVRVAGRDAVQVVGIFNNPRGDSDTAGSSGCAGYDVDVALTSRHSQVETLRS